MPESLSATAVCLTQRLEANVQYSVTMICIAIQADKEPTGLDKAVYKWTISTLLWLHVSRI